MSYAAINIESWSKTKINGRSGIVHNAAIACPQTVVVQAVPDFDLSIGNNFSHCIREIMQGGSDSARNIIRIIRRPWMQHRLDYRLRDVVDINHIISLIAAAWYFDRLSSEWTFDQLTE
jgi:hypothetical protein